MVSRPDRRLKVPQHWADELAASRLGELRLALDVSYTKSMLRSGIDLDREVAGDLMAGAVLARSDGRNGPQYRLFGSRFEVRLVPRVGRNSGRPMAFVVGVQELTGMPRRYAQFRAEVSFWDVTPHGTEEPFCDVAEVEQRILEEQERRNVERHRAAQDLRRTRPPAAVDALTMLHAVATTEYGQLRTMLRLLRQRAERDPAEAGAVVVDPRQLSGLLASGDIPQVALRLAGRSDSFEDQLIEVLAGRERLSRSRVRETRGRDLLLVEPTDDWVPTPGDEVLVRVLPRFAMRRHAEAVDRFLRENVEGYWPDLVRLLSRPAQLVPPPVSPEPDQFFSDSDPDAHPLNEAQRRAVAGALATPHAFLIQGPPGTGKTTVICELVQQLTTRGERVLVLAPTHVAVDEVLSRIGYKPGVRALRIAYYEGRVSEAAAPFLIERVGAHLASIVQRRVSQSERWRVEHGRVTDELGLIRALPRLAHEQQAAAAERAAAASVTGQLRTRAAEERRLRSQAVADAQSRFDHATDAVNRAAAEAELATDRCAEAETTAATLINPLRPALAALYTTASSADAALTSEVGVREDVRRAEYEYASRIRGVVQTIETRVTFQQAAYQYAAGARRRAQELRRELAGRASSAGLVSKAASALGIGHIPRLTRALADAEEGLARATADWSLADAQIRELNAAHARLIAEQDSVLKSMRGTLASRRAASAAATKRWRDATATLQTAGIDQSAYSGGTPQAAAEFARYFEQWLTAALGQEPPAPPTALRHVSAPLAQLRRARRTRDLRSAELSTAGAWRDTARDELDRATTEEAAVAARITGEIDAAAERLVTAEGRLAGAIKAYGQAVNSLGYGEAPGAAELAARLARLGRRQHVLARLPDLERRWRTYVSATSEDLTDDMARSYLNSANLVCATTTGIAGNPTVRNADFDTLIVDEASKVPEGEFLIGAVRARRWVLVGDERQLPPYVEPADEHHLHALTALYRAERSPSVTVERAVKELAGLWEEDEEEHAFRVDNVGKLALELDESGAWADAYREPFIAAHQHLTRRDGDPDRGLLETMRRHLVRSLFERVAENCPPALREPLIEQRRMVAALAAVVQQPVYDGRYVTPPEATLARNGVTPLVTPTFRHPLVLLDTSLKPNAEERPTGFGGFTNEVELRAVIWACETYHRELTAIDSQPVTVSVLALYKPQARAINRELDRLDLPLFKFEVVDAVDKIQGQQSQLVLLSFTRARRGGISKRYGQWLKDIRRLNVACTRARRALVVVAHRETLKRLRHHTDGPVRAFYDNLLELFDDPQRSLVLREFR